MMHMQQVVGRVKDFYWARREDPLGIGAARRSIRRNKTASTTLDLLRHGVTGKAHFGYCPICNDRTIFLIKDQWLRDNYRCIRCNSIPRFRHVIEVLRKEYPHFRELSIHESSPHGPVFEMLKREVPGYVPTHFWPDVSPGTYRNGFRCEDLEALTFPDASFDLVITQDVLEHVLSPARAFAEIARTLKPGGAHIFTIPWYAPKPTFIRATQSTEGIKYFAEKDYHGNPIDEDGALVVTEWGADLPEFIFKHGGLYTTVFITRDRRLGLAGEFLEVFVSRKPV